MWLVTGKAGEATTKPAAAIVAAMASNHSGKLSKPGALTSSGTGVRVAGCQISVRSVRRGAPGNRELGGVGRVVSTHVHSLRLTVAGAEAAAGSVLSPHAASSRQASMEMLNFNNARRIFRPSNLTIIGATTSCAPQRRLPVTCSQERRWDEVRVAVVTGLGLDVPDL